MTNANQQMYDVLVLGGGPAGLTCAIYTARAELKTLVIAGHPAGGQLMLTTEVGNFPGFSKGIMGPALIKEFRNQAEHFGTSFVNENVVKISGSFEEGFTVETDEKSVYKGRSVVIATGASSKWLGIESEARFRGSGVSTCATCDGFFFKNKVVAVVGGGDAAMEESTFLTKFATKVYVLVRGKKEEMRASKIMQERAFSNPKIEFKFSVEVVKILGHDFVKGLKVKNLTTNEIFEMGDVEGVFLAIGHKPNTEFLKDFIELGKMDYAVVNNNTRTSKEGVFVAGDVSDYRYRQAITAAGLGCMAALDVEKLLAEHAKNH